MDERSAIFYAREEGKEQGMKLGELKGKAEGLKEGVEQERQEWIKKIKSLNLPHEEIDKLLA